MLDALTITLNPALDVATSAAEVVPTHKIRCGALMRYPGGGGVNVARVIHRMQGSCTALYLAGGAVGHMFQSLLDGEGVPSMGLEISGETRECFSVMASATQREYRFVPPGPMLQVHEWQACLERVATLAVMPPFVVASGSLPPGAPVDFYARLSRLLERRQVKLVLDTSGPALGLALGAGAYLCKPSLRELTELCGRALESEADWCRAGREVVEQGRAQVLVLSLGAGGAWLFTANASYFAPALSVRVAGTAGAGDSFVGAMVWALAKGFDLPEAFKFGVAGASAALLSWGSGLCQPNDVYRLYAEVNLVRA